MENRSRSVVSLLAFVFILSDTASPAAAAALGRDTAAAATVVGGSGDSTAAAAGVASSPPRGGGGWSRLCDPDTEEEEEGEVYESYGAHGETDNGFAELSHKVSQFKVMVEELKNEYVLARFGNISHAEQSIDMNAPSSSAPNWNLTGATDHETLSRCYENLARLFVLTNLTYEGESSSEEHSVGDFKDGFLNLLQHSSLGIRMLMCDLRFNMNNLEMEELMSNETEAAIDAISFPPVSSEAERHSRDYRVLRIHELSADNMTSIFDRFANSS